MESSHREGLVAFVVTEVLTEASRLQTASVEVSGAQAYTNQQVMDEFSRKLVECITDKPKDQVLIIHTDSCQSSKTVQDLFTLSLSHHRMVNLIIYLLLSIQSPTHTVMICRTIMYTIFTSRGLLVGSTHRWI